MLLPLLLPLCASWWSGGHIIVARIAMKMLTDDQITYLENMFAEWPSENDFPSILEISVWQDVVKASNINMMANWHFSDKEVVAEGYEPKKLIRTYNVTDTIRESIDAIFNESTTSNWSIQFALRSLFHFVGDVHQPLHNSAYFSEEYDSGDAGGNLIYLDCLFGAPCNNLHYMWDSAMLLYQFDDSFSDPEEFEKNVSEILRDFPPERQSPNADTMDPAIMNDEAHAVAKSYSYGLIGDRDIAQLDEIPINDSYMEPCRIQAKRLLSLGGYRLGRILQKFFEARFGNKVTKKTVNVREICAWVVDIVLGGVCTCYIGIMVLDWYRVRKYSAELLQETN
jgi:hypothetical protein